MKIYKTKKDTSVIFIWTLKKQTENLKKKCFLIFREQNRIKIHSKLNQVEPIEQNSPGIMPQPHLARTWLQFIIIIIIYF